MKDIRSSLVGSPLFRSDKLEMRIFPKALLQRGEDVDRVIPIHPAKYVLWKDRDVVEGKKKKKRIDIAMGSVVGKKVHKMAYVRKEIVKRIKVGLVLVISRGADEEGNKIVFREVEEMVLHGECE